MNQRNKPSLSMSIKTFLIKQRVIDIKFNLLIIQVLIQIPSKHDWIHLVFSLFNIIRLDISACYGAGWGVGFYKDYIGIHMGRIIVYLQWWNSKPFTDIKTDWILSRMDYDQIMKMKEVMDDLSSKIEK